MTGDGKALRHGPLADAGTTVVGLETSALIQLDDPDSGATEWVRVHYDGGAHTGDVLKTLIARDGYAVVRQTLLGQVSRFWVGLDPQIRREALGFVRPYPHNRSRVPDTWRVEAVVGYGLVFTGQEEIAASNDPAAFDLGNWWAETWRTTRHGNVSLF